ncbi:MAG: hypothetical protein B7Z08_10895 [Sphingomonadales bacterium 32-68-7]|nr:MAG: hypothetical protein B7Z33_10840 [Sphingomonadales bacterium 12-68-11]OYX08080.1 MAG: hypothetical protein B7Z08_10895 [Sphingomonadales bacterium 32-68-7]
MNSNTPSPPTERRHAERLPMQQVVSFRQPGGDRLSAVLTDLTPDGCRLSGTPEFAAGETVWVWIGGLEGRCTRTIWSDGGSAGVSFAAPLHPAVVARISTLDQWGAPVQERRRERAATATGLPQSRREQILASYVAAPRVLRAKAPAGGKTIAGMIRRNTARIVDLRREPRYPAPAESADKLLVSGAVTTLHDISRGGMRISGATDRAVGQRVVSQFAGCDPITGRVAWKRGEQVGIALPGNSIDLFEDA